MTVELTKSMLIDLVRGTFPNFDLFENRMIAHCGTYNDNQGWQWYNHNLKLYNEEELMQMYKMCKESWGK